LYEKGGFEVVSVAVTSGWSNVEEEGVNVRVRGQPL
jgi:hypothetical protein